MLRHPAGRTAVFVGDLIDRGPRQIDTLRLVRSMIDTDQARIVLGNHEFNAIAYATPTGDGGWCRPRTDKNRRQHEAFLSEVGADSAVHRYWIDWFRTFPLWLDLGGLRVVHACWHPVSMAVLGDGTLTDSIVTAPKGSAEYEALEITLKGPEIGMNGAVYLDKDGNARDAARYKWWERDVDTLREAAEIPSDATSADGVTPFPPLPETAVTGEWPSAPTDAPVLYGHYWRSGKPSIDRSGKSACLDWSVANGGPLVAYRWSSETELVSDNLVESS